MAKATSSGKIGIRTFKSSDGSVSQLAPTGSDLPGGDPNSILYIDGNSQLQADDTFTYNDVTKQLEFNETLLVDGSTYSVLMGDNNNNGNSTRIQINDSISTIQLNSNLIILNGSIGMTQGMLNYGFNVVLPVGVSSIVYTGTGTGTSTLDISGMNIGQFIIVSDLDGKSSTENIQIDSGIGHTIIEPNGSNRTYTLATDRGSVTIQKVTNTQWMVICTNF